MLLPSHMLPKGARSFEVTVNLAVGKEKAKCWRNEVYAQERAHPLLPLGRLTNLLDTKLVWEDGTAVMQCRDKGKWRTMTKFEIRNNMAYAGQMQFEVLRRALWVQQAHPDTIFNWQFWERAAQDPKMTSYLTHGAKAKMCETTPFVNSVGTQYVASRAQLEQACNSLRQQGSSIKTTIDGGSMDEEEAGLRKQVVCRCGFGELHPSHSSPITSAAPAPSGQLLEVASVEVVLICVLLAGRHQSLVVVTYSKYCMSAQMPPFSSSSLDRVHSPMAPPSHPLLAVVPSHP